MPVIQPDDAEVFPAHGSTFHSYVSSQRGSKELCAWRLTIPAGQIGVAHKPSREEVILVLNGELTVGLDGVQEPAGAGTVIVVPAGTEVRVDGGDTDSTAWVTTTPGLQATTADGAVITPPWAQ